jgi:hypothetical protein
MLAKEACRARPSVSTMFSDVKVAKESDTGVAMR